MANAFEEFGPPATPAPRKSNRAPAGGTFYDDVRSVIEPHGGRITSTNGGRHNVGSTHYSGGAVDVGMGRETPEQQETIKAQLLAAGYEVRDERSRPRGQAVWSGPHLHITRPRGGSGGGGGGGVQGTPAANPFAEFDSAPAPSLVDIATGPNPFAEFDAPDFSNLQTAIGGTEAPDYSAAFTDGVEDPSSLGKIGLRALVGRIPTLTANLVELPGNVAGAVGDALGGTMMGTTTRAGFDKAGELVRALGYENDMQAAGYGAPSVTGGQVLDAINPMADVPLGERASRVANFIPETLAGSSPDMLAAIGALPAYIGARTNEVAENRAANDQRANPSLADIAVAGPAATAESLLERLTTLRLLPGGGSAAVRPGVAAAAGRVAKETGLQGASGAVEEAIPYLAETLGTHAPTTGRGLAEALATGLVSEGALGGGVQGVKEAAAAIPTRAQPAPANLADLATPPPTLPAVAAEGAATPRQGDAPAAPPTPAVAVEKQEVAPPKQAAETPTLPAEKINTAPAETAARLDMAAATRSIDDRLAALDEAAAAQIPEAEVSALNAERQELDDLVREQDRARREGIVQPLEARLSPEERATADARRQEITATLERHRAARTAADQAQRLRTRLENADSDAVLYEVAREINPTLGTPQAESFRATAVKEESAPKTQASPPAAPATPSVSVQAPGAPIETNAGTTPNVENVGDRSAQSDPIVGQRVRSGQPSAPPADIGIPRTEARAPVDSPQRDASPVVSREASVSGDNAPRAESQREPAPEAPARTTSIKNAVTDAERVAEGRDPIIRAARNGNRETVDEAVRAIRETPSIGRETAARLAEGGPVELKDEAVLLVHKVDLRKRRDTAAERAQSPNVSEEARAIARREYDDAVQQIDEVDQAASRIGTESGRLLQLRKRMIAEDYSMPALERKLRMVVNRDLKPAEQAEIKELAEKVATLQRKLDAVESQQASAQVAEMLARLMKQAPGKNATLAERRAAAMESKAALSAMSSVRAGQQSIAADIGKPGQARAALADRLGRGVVARLERAGVLEFDERSGGTWDGTKIGIGNVAPENALGVLLHEVTHANMLDVLGEQGYERALRDLDALEAAGDPLALKAKRRAAKSGETGQRLDDERIAYMVEEATNAAAPAPKVTEFVRSLFSAFRRWAATSAVFRALERIGVDRPTLKPADFAAFARKGLDRMVAGTRNPETTALRGKVRDLETQLRTNRLTGLPNRLAFDEDAALGWPTVAFFDVDSFKKLNDQVGHDPADVVLKLIGEEVKKLGSAGIRPYHVSGDEFLFRFKSEADAKPLLDKLQDYLEGVTVELETRDADNNPRFFEYQGIGISYGVGANYDQADSATKLQKQSRLESGAREEPRGDGPSRRIRESPERPGGRREGDPPAVGAQRSIPEPTQTPAFKRWFGDSKVVDSNGDPLVVYHGTTIDFDTFDSSKIGSSTGNGGGFWFAESLKASKFYGPKTVPAFVRMTNPMRVTRAEFEDDFGSPTSWAEYAKDEGHDGLILEDVQDGGTRSTVYAVFDPTQIKSATANRGTFDPADPNIMRSIPEGEDAAPAGADPVAFFHLARMGAFHYADGARTEAEWTKRMEGDLGPAADRYRSMLPDAFKASKAQADRVAKGPETVAEAVEAIGDQRRPRDVKRVVRAVVAEGMRGEDAIISATAQALDMDDADVRTLFVQSESQSRTLTEAQAELKELRKQLRDAQKPDPETRYQDTRARDFQRRIAELEERIAAGDFAKTEKTVHALDEKNTRLEFQLQKVKSEFAFYALEKEFAERAPLAKFTGYIGETFSLLRAIKTSLDLSATLMQGGMMVVNRPYLLKHLKATVKAAWSEELEFEAIKTMQSSPNYPRFKKLGLYLPGTDAQLEKAEEAFAGRWIRKIPTKYGGGLLRASSRSYTTFLNLIRIETFDKMEQSMSLDGQFNEADSKALAKSINIMTGRGSLGRFEDAAGFFNIILFAARFTASRFQVLAGLPLTNTVFGGGPRARRAIRKEYARYMLGAAAFYAFYALVRAPEDWEDDKSDDDQAIDNKRFVEYDPRSVNFGSVRFGDEIFVNPLSGLSQATVFLTRLATGEEKKTMTGKIVPLRDNYRLTDYAPGLGQGWDLGKIKGGKTTLGESGRFLRTKLSPAVGAGVNVMLGKNMIGDEYTWADVPADLTVPMSLGDLVDTVENQGVPRGMAINLAAFLGHARQYRKSDEEKAVEEENGVAGAFGFGTADRSTDEQP